MYPVIALPPSLFGGVQLTSAWLPSRAVRRRSRRGWRGRRRGVTPLESAEAPSVPLQRRPDGEGVFGARFQTGDRRARRRAECPMTVVDACAVEPIYGVICSVRPGRPLGAVHDTDADSTPRSRSVAGIPGGGASANSTSTK